MSGISNTTGQLLGDDLAQSLNTLLTTPLGSRVHRREYGSLLPRLVDQPLNGSTLVRLYAATALAIQRWEPRVRLLKVARTISAGAVALKLTLQRLDTPASATSDLTVVFSSAGARAAATLTASS